MSAFLASTFFRPTCARRPDWGFANALLIEEDDALSGRRRFPG
jgi:hypothetical protein